MSETDEIYQAVRIVMDGLQLSMQLTGQGLAAAQKFVLLTKKTIEKEHQMGKTSMKRLLEKGGDVQVFQFETSRLKDVEKMCKKYGILYSVLPDLKEQDGMTEILFHTSAMGRFRTIMEHLGFGRLLSMEDYLEDETLEEELAKEQEKGGSQAKPETIEELMENLNCLQKYEDETRIPITIDESIVAKETDTSLSFRIPGKYGKRMEVSKSDVYKLKNEKTYLVFLEKEKPYVVFNKEGNVLEQTVGRELKQAFDDLGTFLMLGEKTGTRKRRSNLSRNRGRI